MVIEKNKYKSIITDLKIGNPVAEHDSLLEAARVETPVFSDVLTNKYDIVTGKKGSGKTAIFKILNILSNFLLQEDNIVLLSGVNSAGESIFNDFKKDFSKFSERDFETFWKFYFVSLIRNEFLMEGKFQAKLVYCEKEINKFNQECQKSGIPSFPKKQEKKDMVNWLVSIFSGKIKKAKLGLTTSAATPGLFGATAEFEFEEDKKSKKEKLLNKENVYVNDIARSLEEILKKSGFKIWVVLDRLDEVFDRYSSVEFNGLRGLLIAYKSFLVDERGDCFRIKLFLRDDIVDFLTNDAVYKKYFKGKHIPPLPAATHIFAKQSPTLNWSEDQIEQLVLNRLLLNLPLAEYVGLPEDTSPEKLKEILSMKTNRKKFWNKIFPENISTSTSLKWIFTRLKDGNNIITPRSVIDMLEAAMNYQREKISINFEDSSQIFPVDSIKNGLAVASKNKLEKDIYNEFPREQKNIKKLEKEGKIKLTKKDLIRIYGKEDWEETVSILQKIGIIRYVKDSRSYRVEYLYRPALELAYSY